MEMRFLDTAKNFLESGTKLLPFSPFPPASNRAAYDGLPAELKERLTTAGETCLGYQYPPIYATSFMAFKRTGNRTDFEKLYFQRRYRLNSLVVAECIENSGRFLDDIINGIFALCEESGWQLPPHNAYRRDQAQELLPDATRPVLDLFACETGAQLGCIYYLLKEQLDAVSPVICARILDELNRRIVTPYLSEHFWWMGQGEEPMCNWTPWCTQNVLLAVFLTENPQDIRRAVLEKAAAGCDFFLKDYGDDGCCDEGAQYFRRAGLCLDAAVDLMNSVTGGAFRQLYEWQKMKNVASYIENMHVDGAYYFNFADCSPVPGRAGVRDYLFGKHTAQPSLMRFAAKDFQTAQDEIYDEEIYQLSLYYRLQNAFYYREVMSYDTSAPLSAGDIYYPSIGLFIARSPLFALAVKAGDNDDNHNHNDTGSLTLYKNGQPVLADIGVESYTGKTFSAQRYEIWTMQSGYHNLPTLDGQDECAGADYRAVDVETSFGAENASISMELAYAYPPSDGSSYYRRTVTLDKTAGRVLLTDKTDFQNVILNFIVCEKPEIEGNSLKLPDSRMEFSGASLLTVETLPITDARLQTAWKSDLYRVRLTMTEKTFTLDIR